MGILWVAVVIVVAIGCTSTEEIIPEYAKCANILFDRVQDKLTRDMTSVKNTIKMINMKMENLCITNTQQVPQEAETTPPYNLQEKMEALMQKVEAMDNKINDALTKISAMETTLQKTEQLATSQDLSHLNGSVGSMLDETNGYIELRFETMATKAQVEELLGTHFSKVEQVVTEASEACGSEAKLTEVLQEVRGVKEDVAKVANETEATREEVNGCIEQDSMQELRNVMTRMEALQENVQDLETGLEEELHNVKEVLVEVFNNTQPPPPPPPTTTLAPGFLNPCEDSTFRGTNSIDVCQSAVRFNKCHLETVSYHCCHTCTSAGQLPEVGPWRYVNYNRQVPILDVVRFFSL